MCFSSLQDITLFNNMQALILTISGCTLHNFIPARLSHWFILSFCLLLETTLLPSITAFLIRLGEESHSVVFLLWMPCMQLCLCQESMVLMCRLSYLHADIPAFHQCMRKSNNMLVVRVLSSFRILYSN